MCIASQWWHHDIAAMHLTAMPPSTAIPAAAERADGEKTRVRHARVPPTREDSRARYQHAAHSKSTAAYQHHTLNDGNNCRQRRRHRGHARNPRRRCRSGCVRPLPRRCSHVLLQRHAPVCVSAYVFPCAVDATAPANMYPSGAYCLPRSLGGCPAGFLPGTRFASSASLHLCSRLLASVCGIVRVHVCMLAPGAMLPRGDDAFAGQHVAHR
jgi:hypothetical protein